MATKKKYVAKKRKSFKRKSTVKKLAKKVNALYRSIESKYCDVTGLGALPTNDPSLAIRPYQSVILGTGDFKDRTGDKISVKYVRVNSTWELAAGAPGRSCRVIAFIYKNNPDAVISPISTIWNLCMDSATANSVNVVNSFKDHDNTKSFSIVKDFSFDLNPVDSAVGYTKNVDFVIKVPKNLQQVQYVAGTPTISRNELFIFFVQEVDTNVSINYACRFNYTDM